MIIDSTLEFADATALSTAATGLALVGNVIDTGAVVRDLGNGKQMWLIISVDTQVGSSAAASVSFTLASDAQAAIAVDGSATVHWTSASIDKATLAPGYQFAVALPLQNPPYERYLGILQNVSTTALNAGKINAYLTFDPPGGTIGAPAYADAIN